MADINTEIVDAIKSLKQKTQLTLKRIYGWFLLHGHNAAGGDKPILVEDDGTLRAALYGKDSAGPNLDPLLTSPEKVLYTEQRNPGEYVSPDDMPATNTTFYTNSNTGFLVDVEVEIVNNSSTDATVIVDLVESGGTAAVNRRILNSVPVFVKTIGIRLGPYTLEVSGTVQGLCSVANACTIHVWVKEKRRITP